MSQREKEPRVLSPAGSRNGNPTSLEPERFILLMRAFPHLQVGQCGAHCNRSISQRTGPVRGPGSKWAQGRTHQFLREAPSTLSNTSILPGATATAIFLAASLSLVNSKVRHDELKYLLLNEKLAGLSKAHKSQKAELSFTELTFRIRQPLVGGL